MSLDKEYFESEQKAVPTNFYKNNLLVIPFSEINKSLWDIVDVYIKPIVTVEGFKALSSIKDVCPKGDAIVNVFTEYTWEVFLQMISLENYKAVDGIAETVDYEVIYGPDKELLRRMPVLDSSRTGKRIYNNISKSAYRMFDRNELWVIRMKSKEVLKGFSTVLTEVNVYIPKHMVKDPAVETAKR